MTIEQMIAEEIGGKLLENDAFLDALVIKLAEKMKPSQIIQIKPSRIKNAVSDNRNRVMTIQADSVEIFHHIKPEVIRGLFEHVMTLKPHYTFKYSLLDFFSIKPLDVKFLRKYEINSKNILLFMIYVCRSFDFIHPTFLSEVPVFKINYREIKQDRVSTKLIDLKLLRAYQDIIETKLDLLLIDIEDYKDYLVHQFDFPEFRAIDKRKMDTLGYVDFIEVAIEVGEPTLKRIYRSLTGTEYEPIMLTEPIDNFIVTEPLETLYDGTDSGDE